MVRIYSLHVKLQAEVYCAKDRSHLFSAELDHQSWRRWGYPRHLPFMTNQELQKLLDDICRRLCTVLSKVPPQNNDKKSHKRKDKDLSGPVPPPPCKPVLVVEKNPRQVADAQPTEGQQQVPQPPPAQVLITRPKTPVAPREGGGRKIPASPPPPRHHKSSAYYASNTPRTARSELETQMDTDTGQRIRSTAFMLSA